MPSPEFEQFFRKHDAVFLLMDGETGQLLDANDAALRFYGYTLPQIRSMRISDIDQLPPDEVEVERERAVATKRAFFVVPHRLAGGEIRTVEVRTAPVVLEGGTCLFSVVHDITELERAREALREEGRALAEAERVAHMGSWQWDIASDTITWSDELCRLNGHDPALPTPSYEEHLKMYTPESAQRLDSAVQAAMEWVPYELDVELARPDGSHWSGEARGEPVLGAHGEVVGLRGTLTDITGRVRSEDALREAEDMFEWVFAGSAVPRSITGTNGEVRVNAALCEMLGYAPEELADGTTWMGLTHPDDVAETQRQMERLISGEQTTAHYEKRFLRKDGVVVWADIHSALRRGADGQSLYFGTTMIDVTERKRVEEALRESEEKYRSLFNNAQVGMFRTRLDGSEMLDANDKFLEIFGRSRDEVIGKTSVLHWADPCERDEMVRRLTADGRVTDFECRMLDRDGKPRECVTSLRLYPEQGILEGSIEDITDRKATERRVSRLNGVYAVLSSATKALVHAREPEAVFDAVCSAIVEHGDFLMAWVGLVSADGVHVDPVSRAGSEEGYLDSMNIVLGDGVHGGGPTGRAISERRHVISRDIEHDPTMSPWRDSALRNGFRASAAFPLIVGDVVVGAFCVYSAEPGLFDDEEIALLDELASDISFALSVAEAEVARRQAEESLRISESRYRTISETVTGFVFSCVQEPGEPYRIDWIAGAVEPLTGYSLDEVLERTCWRFMVLPEDQGVFDASVVGLDPGEEAHADLRIVRADGKVSWIRSSARCQQVEGRPGSHKIFGACEDVTARKEAEQRHDAILRTALDGFWTADTDGRLLEVNQAYCRMSGYTERELLAMNIRDLDATESEDDVAAHSRKIVEMGHDLFETRHRRKDGGEFDVENSISYQPESGHFAAFIRNITRRKQREEYGQLSREVLVILNEPGDPYDFLQRIVSVIKDRTGFDAVGIRLREGEDFPYRASEGFSESHLQAENTLIARDEAGQACRDERGDVALECTCGLVLSGRGDPLLSPGGSFWTSDSFPLLDLTPEEDPRLHPRNLCILEGFASVALVPIRGKQNIVGLVHLADRRKDRFNGETVQLLEDIAIHIGEAMTRKRAEERIGRTLTSVIDIARDIVEERDPYTAGHQLRVCEIAVRVAQDLGMSDSDVNDIRIAALIHDVGKVVVPTEILSKPGAISKTEYELLKAHAEAGHRILASAHMEEPVPELVYQHHERCDGSGYPRGLTGDQMLMGAKVIAVADVVEAMMSHRPYRPALGLEAALAEIERGAGRLYDADVARACLGLFREEHFELAAPPA